MVQVKNNFNNDDLGNDKNTDIFLFEHLLINMISLLISETSYSANEMKW